MRKNFETIINELIEENAHRGRVRSRSAGQKYADRNKSPQKQYITKMRSKSPENIPNEHMRDSRSPENLTNYRRRCISPENSKQNTRNNYRRENFHSKSPTRKSNNLGVIYVLKLEDEKYYVGSTINLDRRYQEHCTGIGSTWTNIYKPINILEVSKCNTLFDEDNKTKEMMMKYGIENVRGGSYSEKYLKKGTIAFLTKEIQTLNNLCYLCSSPRHYARQCPYS